MLIELYHGSKLLENISEDKIGGKQYIQNKRHQLDQMIRYARTDKCRGQVVRQYFGKALVAIIVATSVISAIRVSSMPIIR